MLITNCEDTLMCMQDTTLSGEKNVVQGSTCFALESQVGEGTYAQSFSECYLGAKF